MTAAAASSDDVTRAGRSDGEPQGGAGSNSGALVATLFHRALAAIFLIAWLSLASQILVLVGSRGLLPLADFVSAARAENVLSFGVFPSILAWAPGDGTLLAGCLAGAALALLALILPLRGVRPRLCAALQTAWYLGYVTACRGFLGFQWDNLLLECGLLAAFLPTDRPAPLAHLLFRAVLFKLYFESGLAKWQSPLHDWRDGTAMTFYYQTAPLPTALAWYAHHLPRWWHLFESRATLVIELVVPVAIFGPRRARYVAAVLFTLFQIVNAATANYGFFCYLTVALHLFLLDDAQLRSLVASGRRQLSAVLPWARSTSPAARDREPAAADHLSMRRVRPVAASGGAAVWLLVSLLEAWFHFGEPGPLASPLLPALEWSQTFRIVNAYHLFAAVTRDRIEPEFQVQATADGPWVPFHLHYKPGPPERAPPFVAPHQPRVDFLLWFYGVGFDQRQPAFVAALQARLCDDPTAVAALFVAPLPAKPAAVRIAFWDYRFTTRAEKAESGAWWIRRQIGTAPIFACGPEP